MSGYQRIIRDLCSTVNPAGVEASMRLNYGTLDHLDRSTFRDEIRIAQTCEEASPGFLRRAAESFGMAADFDKWEAAA